MERETTEGGDASRGKPSQSPPPPAGNNPSAPRAPIAAGLPYGQPADDGSSRRAPAPPSDADADAGPSTTAESANAFANDPARTHRTWAAVAGKVQKCDFCNGRSQGVLFGCETCKMLRICETCARGGRWHTDRSHFIVADDCDWKYKPPPRKRGPNKRTRAVSTSTASTTPFPNGDRSPSPRPPRKRRPGAQTSARSANNTGDDLVDPDLALSGRGAGRQSFMARREGRLTSLRHAEIHDDRVGDAAMPSAASGSNSPIGGMGNTLRRPQEPSPLTTAAGTRPSARQAAARALEEMSYQSHQPRRVQYEDDGTDVAAVENNEENEESGGEYNVSNRGHRRGNQAPRDVDTYTSTGTNTWTRTNDGSGYQSPGARRPEAPDPLVVAGLRPGTPGGRDMLVADIYESLYRVRPVLDPYRAQTQIPNSWGGPWSTTATHAGQDAAPYDQYPNAYRPHAHEQYRHEHHHAPTARHDPSPSPAPRSYEHSYDQPGFHSPPQNYPQQHQQQQQNPYHPHPHPHPHNEPTPEQLQQQQQQMHNDRTLLAEMQHAWARDPTLARLFHAGFRTYALGLLWDVFDEARRQRQRHGPEAAVADGGARMTVGCPITNFHTTSPNSRVVNT
ncbi:hypothetical protein BT67DRAFT_458711 [Trichocladium antarcticum]|uniref:Uncharacterized protein n=1 Tax=Trichocladium antarcticum TaxID=1450529 RepID=A0AAN6UCD6_9PEZI|nr:hypothetical protein BT67DRAFT_458711 [Trichocladium antarcticum]